MPKFISIVYFILVLCGYFLSSSSWAKTSETNFDNSFYIMKICKILINGDGYEGCEDGYILKGETLKNNKVKETVFMDELDGYAWDHTVINKIDLDTYLVHIGCGSSCGANMLIGRRDKVQYFDLYFNFDIKSKCTVEYNSDKNLWIARRFFSDKEIFLPSTHAVGMSVMYPKYNVEFDQKSNIIIKEFMEDKIIKRLPNPCTAH